MLTFILLVLYECCLCHLCPSLLSLACVLCKKSETEIKNVETCVVVELAWKKTTVHHSGQVV